MEKIKSIGEKFIPIFIGEPLNPCLERGKGEGEKLIPIIWEEEPLKKLKLQIILFFCKKDGLKE